jgi:hypothetical protein
MHWVTTYQGEHQDMKKTFLLTCLICFALAGTSTAQSFTYELDDEPVFTIDYPIGWTILTEKDEDLVERPDGVPPMPLLVTARPKSGLLWLGTWVMRKIDTFEEAEEYLRSLVGHLFKDVTTNRLEEGVHNGMTFRYYDGTAVKTTTGPNLKKDEKVDYFVAFFRPRNDLMGIAIYIGLPNASDKYGELLKETMRTITPVKSGR